MDSVVTTLVSRQPIDRISGEQAEGALRYVFELGEAVRFDAARLGAPTVANTSLTEAQRVARLVNAILESSVITHSSSIAHIALFELYDRYYAYFIANRHHVPTLLQQFLTSSSGIRHPDARVRSRACYLFSHTVSMLKAQYAVFAADIVQAVMDAMDLITSPGSGQPLLGPTERCDLFEAVGVIMNASNNLSTCGAISQRVLGHLAHAVAAYKDGGAASATSAAAGEDSAGVRRAALAQTISEDISFLTALMKGVGGVEATRMPDSPSLGSQSGWTAGSADAATAAASTSTVHPVFHQMTDQVIEAASTCVMHANVRERTLESMQQVINVLGQDAIPYVVRIVNGFFQQAPQPIAEIPKTIRVVYQTVNKTRGYCALVMGEVLLPAVIRRVLVLGSPAQLTLTHNVLSESTRELTEVYKALLVLLHAVTHSNACIGAALSHPNTAEFQSTLFGTILLQALRVPVETELPRLSLQILSRMTLHWADAGSEAMHFILDTVWPAVLDVLTTPSMISCSDAKGFLVIGEALILLRCTLAKGSSSVGTQQQPPVASSSSPPGSLPPSPIVAFVYNAELEQIVVAKIVTLLCRVATQAEVEDMILRVRFDLNSDSALVMLSSGGGAAGSAASLVMMPPPSSTAAAMATATPLDPAATQQQLLATVHGNVMAQVLTPNLSLKACFKSFVELIQSRRAATS